jgi:hypothetical protein
MSPFGDVEATLPVSSLTSRARRLRARVSDFFVTAGKKSRPPTERLHATVCQPPLARFSTRLVKIIELVVGHFIISQMVSG